MHEPPDSEFAVNSEGIPINCLDKSTPVKSPNISISPQDHKVNESDHERICDHTLCFVDPKHEDNESNVDRQFLQVYRTKTGALTLKLRLI